MGEVQTDIKIHEAVKDAPKDVKKRKLRRTNLFFTINTNKSYNDMDERRDDAQKEFVKALEKWLDRKIIGEYIIFTDKFKHHSYTSEYFKQVKIDIVPEFGPERGFLHIHGVIAIAHRSSIRFNFQLLKERLCKELNLPNIYMQYRLFFDTKVNIEDYIHKTRFYKSK
jgi:tRNA nucleotidyltransferase (CCA-adding enzyme)